MDLTAKRLRELLDYNPETGVFIWKNPPRRKDYIGREAGKKKGKYVYILVDGKLRLAHRLAWLYVHKTFPKLHIDHKNGDGRDNRIDNLREATRSDNLCNIGARKDNSTGFKGVFPKRSRFSAQIKKDGVRLCLGTFDTPAEAHAAYCKAAHELHGMFAGGVR